MRASVRWSWAVLLFGGASALLLAVACVTGRAVAFGSRPGGGATPDHEAFASVRSEGARGG